MDLFKLKGNKYQKLSAIKKERQCNISLTQFVALYEKRKKSDYKKDLKTYIINFYRLED